MKKESNRERLSVAVANLYDAATIVKMVRMSGEIDKGDMTSDTLGQIEQSIDRVTLDINDLLATDQFRKRGPAPWWRILV
jgi:hypothetical protein